MRLTEPGPTEQDQTGQDRIAQDPIERDTGPVVGEDEPLGDARSNRA